MSEVTTKSKWAEWAEKLNIAKFIGTLAIGIGLGWTALQLTAASQAYAIQQLRLDLTTTDKKVDNNKSEHAADMESIKRSTVSRELFEERTKNIMDAISRVENIVTQERMNQMRRESEREKANQY